MVVGSNPTQPRPPSFWPKAKIKDVIAVQFRCGSILLKNSVSEINEKSLAHRPDKIFWVRGGIKIS